MTTTTWNSLGFGIQTSESVPLPERALLYAVRPIPYSDASVLDVSGRGETRFKATIRLLPAALAAWRATLGQTHSLILEDVVYATSVLVGLTNIRRLPRNDYLWADVEWVCA